MSILNQPGASGAGRSSSTVIFAGILALAVVAGAILFLATGGDKPATEPAAAVAPPPEPGPPAPAPAPPEPVPEPEPERRAAPRAPRTAAPPPAPAAPAAPTTATLTIDSDVTGASVFIDRVFVGETPVTIPNLAPGTRQLQLSADGYESIRRSIDVEAGPARLTLRFREVRLDQRLNVVHKHGMGSCEGTLVATIDGLRYETSNRNDGFTLAFDQLDTFTVDYMDKNLRVKQRGGRTWNFTQRDAANADALFVFHRDVEAARAKLAQGYAPVKP